MAASIVVLGTLCLSILTFYRISFLCVDLINVGFVVFVLVFICIIKFYFGNLIRIFSYLSITVMIDITIIITKSKKC